MKTRQEVTLGATLGLGLTLELSGIYSHAHEQELIDVCKEHYDTVKPLITRLKEAKDSIVRHMSLTTLYLVGLHHEGKNDDLDIRVQCVQDPEQILQETLHLKKDFYEKFLIQLAEEIEAD